ncbi:hypothetical protein VKT23_015442 [Stygiomarasmius scandens]|uniref:MACPF domain-containing protein n=1 Tax=Marasmiellus scandens TaxID=2682957 RepID=A0ABR1J0H0_9AGAR
MPEFSAADWLGYSMNMVGTTPLDTNSATKAVQNARRILTIDDATRDLEVDGVTYKVSKSISVLENKGTTSDFVTYPTGNEAATAFRNDSRLAALFMSITGDPSVAIATEKHHRRNVQYAYYCYSQGKYLAFLKDYADSLNETSILAGIRGLPTPFNGENQDVLQKYKDFFQRFGTHVITKVNYGAHLQLVC